MYIGTLLLIASITLLGISYILLPFKKIKINDRVIDSWKIDVLKNVTGKNEQADLICSFCKKSISNKFSYCPSCGKQIDEGPDEEN